MRPELVVSRAWSTSAAVLTGAAVLAMGAVAVATLPDLARVLPGGRRPEPNATQFALTATGIVILTAGYLWVAAVARRLPRAWYGLALAANSAVVAVKLILSPVAYRQASAATLGEYVRVGLVVLPFYVGALVVIEAMRRWARTAGVGVWPARAALAGAAIVCAFAARGVAVVVLGTSADGYLHHAFSGAGLWLPGLLAIAAVATAAAFDIAAPAGGSWPFLVEEAGLLVGYHLLWVLYMYRLFA